jgi:hypothetical protein
MYSFYIRCLLNNFKMCVAEDSCIDLRGMLYVVCFKKLSSHKVTYLFPNNVRGFSLC